MFNHLKSIKSVLYERKRKIHFAKIFSKKYFPKIPVLTVFEAKKFPAK